MTDRLSEIRARLDRFRPDMPWVTVGEGSPAWDGAKWQELFLHAPDDLRWLLAELDARDERIALLRAEVGDLERMRGDA